jgi:hypothetical protein
MKKQQGGALEVGPPDFRSSKKKKKTATHHLNSRRTRTASPAGMDSTDVTASTASCWRARRRFSSRMW